MKRNRMKILGCVLAVSAMVSQVSAYTMPNAYASTSYGSSYQNGTYQYGQAYGQTGYQTSYYGQGYSGYQQGYQGYYGGTGYSGMGQNFSYVDNNWIEDNLRFAVADVNQNRPYQAMQRLQTVMGYVRQFGDSQLYRRVSMVASLGYRSTLTQEVNGLYNEFKAGNLRVGWDSTSNQSYNGQDDISQDYVLAQLNAAKAELTSGNSSAGRQRLSALVQAIPPLGNDRLIRRVYYATSMSKPSEMAAEVQSIAGEIQSGSLVLNDTVNTAYNYYYGGTGVTNPYGQPDQSAGYGTQYQNGGGALPTLGAGQYGSNPYATYTPTNGTDTGLPAFGTVQYTAGASTTTNYLTADSTYVAPVTDTATTVTNTAVVPATTTAAAASSTPDLAQLQANVSVAYEKLKTALANGDRDGILAAQQEYQAAQSAYDAAKR